VQLLREGQHARRRVNAGCARVAIRFHRRPEVVGSTRLTRLAGWRSVDVSRSRCRTVTQVENE